MLVVQDIYVSDDIADVMFICDLEKCKGACCVEGDSGAPLTDEEAKIIEAIYHEVEPYLSEHNRAEVKRQGFSIIDSDGDLVTPIIGNKECVYTYRDEAGIVKCGIERAYLDGKTDFRKPVSCHLFPIRITEYKRFDAVNYQELDICKPGKACGKKEQLPLWKFLKEPLIRKYGKEWYEELQYAAENISRE